MLVLAMFCSTAVVRGSDLTVGDGTSTNNYIPVNFSYGDEMGTRSQVLYSSSLLGDMNGKEISSLKFYSSRTSSLELTTEPIFSVKLAEVAETELNGFLTPTFTTVYTGTIAFASGSTIVFSTPYVYGGGNLLLDVEVTSAGSYDIVPWDGLFVSKASYSNRNGMYANVAHFLPKTTFTYGASSSTCAKPEEVSTGSVEAKNASINWSKAAGVDYVQYSLVEGTAAPSEWSEPTTDASKELTGLKPETKYTLYLRSYCSASDQSGYIKTEFTTTKSCFAPEALTVSNIGANSATIGWGHSTSGSEMEYEYICVKENATPDWSKAIKNNSMNAELTGLDPARGYDVYVRSFCGTDDVSESIKETFATICGKITKLPYSENFDEGSGLPLCWHRATLGSFPQISSKQLFFNLAAGDAQIVVLPEIDLEMKQLTIEFKYNTNTYDVAGNATVEVGYVNESDNFTALSSTYGSSLAYTPVSFKLKDAPTEAVNIAIRVSAIEACFAYVDDVLVKKTPDCPNPKNLTKTAETYNSASFAWEQGEDETIYQYAVVPKDADVAIEKWNKTEANVREATVSGLTSGTDYEFVLRSYCSDSEHGEEFRLAFTLVCGSVEGVKVGGITNNSAIISWNKVDHATKYTVKIGSETKDVTGSTTLTWSGLDENTSYEVSVKIAEPCDGAYSAGVSFKTSCAAVSLPFSEDFEGVTSKVPECWRRISEHASTGVVTGPASYGGEGKCFDFFGTETQKLVLPEMEQAMVDLTISFFYKSNNNSVISVGYFEPGDDTFVSLKALEVLAEYGEAATAVDLKNASENAQHIVIQCSGGDSSYGQTFVDNISVQKTSDIGSSIETVESINGTSKRLENGQLIIIRDGVRYNAIGTIVK